MIKTLWILFCYKPLYNTLALLVDVLPKNSLLIAIIVLTLLVRLIISPLSFKSIKTQIQTKKIQPKLQEIKKKITDKQEQAKKTLELYKEYNINPFSGFLLILIQFPIIIALYWVFRDGVVSFDPTQLYSFIKIPDFVNMSSFGVNLSQKSYILAALTGVTQLIHISLSSGFKKVDPNENQSEQEKIMTSVGQSMKYTLPVMVTIFAYTLGSAIAIYWITSNIFMIFQERYTQKKLKNS